MTPKLRQLNASILGQTAVAWLAAWLWPLLLLAPFGGPMAVFFWGYGATDAAALSGAIRVSTASTPAGGLSHSVVAGDTGGRTAGLTGPDGVQECPEHRPLDPSEHRFWLVFHATDPFFLSADADRPGPSAARGPRWCTRWQPEPSHAGASAAFARRCRPAQSFGSAATAPLNRWKSKADFAG